MEDKIVDSFNNIKNKIYKNNNFASRYDFQELAEILTRKDFDEDEIEVLKLLTKYVNNIGFCVENLGSRIIDTTTIDFSNKIRLEAFIREIIEIIDEFVDSLNAINSIIEFNENRMNVEISIARLKSLRNSLIKKMNEYSRKTNGITLNDDQTKFMRILLTDIIDSIIRESFKLRIQKLSEVLNSRFND